MSQPAASAAQRLLDLVDITWPRFVLLRGCVIRDQPGVEAAFEQWWALHSDEPWRIEGVTNHVHLYDIVDPDDDDVDGDRATLEQAAERIAEAWRAALAAHFPDLTMEVTIATEPDEYGPIVSCHQPVA